MINSVNELPQSEHLNISSLSRLFKNTTNSYKYLFFMSFLDILTRRKFDTSSPIYFREIIIEMLANAWYPHNCFKLSFGVQDKITEKIDSLDLKFSRFKDPDKKELREAIGDQNLDDIIAFIRRYVPFRLLTPFLKQELKGLDVDHEVDQKMPSLSKKYFETRKPLYCFDATAYKDCQAIILHSEWASYLETNYLIVRGWVSWEWLRYMQRCNPNTIAIANKLFPPQKRESLASQTKYWKLVLKHTEVKCIYSASPLTTDNISLDHYLPWSFVAHDQLWNLIPILPPVNSAKSNNIPSIIYFNNFVALQHLGLTISYEKIPERQWNKYIESYLSDLRLADKNDLLNFERLRQAYESTLTPLISLATSQGFMAGWLYQIVCL